MAKNKSKTKVQEIEFSKIKKNHILKAFQEIDENGVPRNAHSTTYDVLYRGKRYPPKYVLSLANKYVTGSILSRNTFQGGQDTPCFNLITSLGFNIIPKITSTDLSYKKNIDRSLLTAGFTIPVDLIHTFTSLLGDIEGGLKKDIKIEFKEELYDAKFYHAKLKNGKNYYQIIYNSSSPLAKELQDEFSYAHSRLNSSKNLKKDNRSTKLSSEFSEILLITYNHISRHLVFEKKSRSFIPVLEKFINQAQTKDLKYGSYIKEYEGLRVRVSFGQRNLAEIPWISFLSEGNKVSYGIYPVYLYYKKEGKLILSYGVSEDNKPLMNWELNDNALQISSYFKENGLGKPTHYGGSWIYKVYDVADLNIAKYAESIDSDLRNIISEYKTTVAETRSYDNLEEPIDTHMGEIQDIKAEMAKELVVGNPDINKILELSSRLASLDKNNVRFSIDAGIIDRLGKELVGRQETALSELIKNGYDADATNVGVYFVNCENDSGGTIIIDDNGTGMNHEQLINGFMRISSADKIHNPKSKRYKRRRAGRKGIGRFATQRLGEKLELITQTKNQNTALKVTIDWKAFENDIDLALISSRVEQIKKEREEGTILKITNVREKWNETSVRRAYRYISDLLQPFPLSKTLEKTNLDPGFKATFYTGYGKQAKKIIDEQKAFYDHALAEIEGFVDDSGKGHWRTNSNKIDLAIEGFLPLSADDKEHNVSFTNLRNVHFKAYYFIYDATLLAPQIRSYVQENAREYGGIRLYRNGFRVLPYGEKGDDWLGLDKSVRQRLVLPPHGNINMFGFVELIDEDGVNFEETSSREGLLSNEAFEELKDFVYRVILEAVLKVAEARGRKGRATEKRAHVENLIDETINAIEELAFKGRQEKENLDNTNDYDKENTSEDNSAEYERIIDKLKILKTQTSDILSELSLTRILAGLGLTITQFVHEIKHYIPAIELDIDLLSEEINGYNEVFERLTENINGFFSYTSYYDEAVSQNVLRELHPIEIRDVVNSFEKAISPELARSKIIIHKDPNGQNLFTVPMHKSEWASILMNLYTNSRKAIKRAGRKGRILIKYGKFDNKVYLEFSDNGDGIKEENKDKIFNAFFTTSKMKGANANVYQEVVGTGLGLKIVKDIIEGYRGNISVVSPSPEYTTTIRIEIPSME